VANPHAAQKEFSAAQTQIESQRFLDILDGFPLFSSKCGPKSCIFGNFCPMRPRDQFGLATPVLSFQKSYLCPKKIFRIFELFKKL
jgi:hypothetical protein